MSKQREQDSKPDKGGNRGSNYGHGKMGTAHEGFGPGHVKQGHKKLQTIPVLNKGNTVGGDGNDSLRETA